MSVLVTAVKGTVSVLVTAVKGTVSVLVTAVKGNSECFSVGQRMPLRDGQWSEVS